METFRGRGAIVTGAASGIGLGLARALAKAGADVALADHMRREGRLASGTSIAGALRLFLGAADVPRDPPAGWVPRPVSRS